MCKTLAFGNFNEMSVKGRDVSRFVLSVAV